MEITVNIEIRGADDEKIPANVYFIEDRGHCVGSGRMEIWLKREDVMKLSLSEIEKMAVQNARLFAREFAGGHL